MKKLLVSCVLFSILINCSQAYCASLIITPQPTNLGYTKVYTEIDSGFIDKTAYSGTGVGMVVEAILDSASWYRQTSRAFCDFNLQNWYALGVPSANITKITFKTSVAYWDTGAKINFYARTGNNALHEDGKIIFDDDNDSPVSSAIFTNISNGINSGGVNFTVESGVTYLTLTMVNMADLQYFIDDINASKQYTGISMRMLDETPAVTMTYTTDWEFRDANNNQIYPHSKRVELDINNDPNKTTLEIEYTTTPFVAIPEPLSIVSLCALITINALRRKLWK